MTARHTVVGQPVWVSGQPRAGPRRMETSQQSDINGAAPTVFLLRLPVSEVSG
jgi:hypothetical protein